MIDITNRLPIDQTEELEVYLGTQGSSRTQGRKVFYEEDDLVVEYMRNGTLKSIQVADDFGASRLDHFIGGVTHALSQGEREVRCRFLHCMNTVEGWFRQGDEFQLLPAPPTAPQPDFAVAYRSFLIEFSYVRSPDWIVNQHRAQRRFSEISLVLNALVRGLQLPATFVMHEWVVDPEPDPTSTYAQLGYFADTEYLEKDDLGFSVIDDLPPIEQTAAQSYYGGYSISAGEPLSLPNSIDESLSRYRRLSHLEKARFCRASYWTHVGSRIHGISQSAAFGALVSAVEVFLPEVIERCESCKRPTHSERCPQCSQPLSGPTRQFREFVDRYAPGVPATRRNKLYSVRSSLTHGSTLMPGDLSEIGFRATPNQMEARRDRDLLVSIVRITMINWLYDPDTIETDEV